MALEPVASEHTHLLPSTSWTI